MGQGTTTSPRAGQRTQGSGLPVHAPLLPRHQVVLFGGWCSLEPQEEPVSHCASKTPGAPRAGTVCPSPLPASWGDTPVCPNLPLSGGTWWVGRGSP